MKRQAKKNRVLSQLDFLGKIEIDEAAHLTKQAFDPKSVTPPAESKTELSQLDFWGKTKPENAERDAPPCHSYQLENGKYRAMVGPGWWIADAPTRKAAERKVIEKMRRELAPVKSKA